MRRFLLAASVALLAFASVASAQELPILPGDYNGDGKVLLPDYWQFFVHFDQEEVGESINDGADLNGNGQVGILDFVVLLENTSPVVLRTLDIQEILAFVELFDPERQTNEMASRQLSAIIFPEGVNTATAVEETSWGQLKANRSQ